MGGVHLRETRMDRCRDVPVRLLERVGDPVERVHGETIRSNGNRVKLPRRNDSARPSTQGE